MDNLPKMLVIWGQGSGTEFNGPGYDWANAIVKKGGRLVVIDPRRLRITEKADLWLKPRPGSDAALGMGFIKVIVEEELYDKEFIKNWTVGFDKLQEEVKKFTLDDVERTTWISKEHIQQIARWYGELKHVTLLGRGNTWSQGSRNFQAMRVIEILRSIVDPINIPNWGYSIKRETQQTPAAKMYLIDKFGWKVEGNLAARHKYAVRAAYIPNQDLVNGILDDKIKAVIHMQADPLITYPDARKVYEAFMKVELSVTANIFMVPTAAVSDYVLPVATTNECDTIAASRGGEPFRAIPQIVPAPGEALSDVMILNKLGQKLGLGEYFFDSDIESIEYAIEPSGLSWEEYKKIRTSKVKREPKPEEGGFFTTASGRLEIYSERAIEVYGCDPLPTWEHVTNFPQPSDEYPLLATSHCEEEFKLSGYKHVRYCRKRSKFPKVQLNPEVADSIGAKDGDWVWIETPKGRVMQMLVVDPELDPRVVMTTFGWYFPEEPANANQWDKANINVLFPDYPVETATGSVDLRGFPCKVYRADESEVGLEATDAWLRATEEWVKA
ncbi:molybdopterin-dependent oxidoreductase [Chloroflexota bacterium]